MRRREFFTLLGGAVAWPIAVRAQQPAMPVVGFLRSSSVADSTSYLISFRWGLLEAGYIEGQNVVIEAGYSENDPDRLKALVAEMVRRPVAVIVANVVAAALAKAATTTMPIVFVSGSDPIQEGLVTSLNRPGGNVTGVFFLVGNLGTKRLELLRQLLPKATMIGLIVDPNSPEAVAEKNDVKAAAHAIGQQLLVLEAGSDRDIETTFATLAQRDAGAVLVGAGPFLTSRREQVVALAARHSLPAIYVLREFVKAGGLMSYGTSITDAYRQVGNYTGRILNGEKPSDLPIMQSSKFEFVINLKTSKSLGLTIPPTMLAIADDVIE